MKLFSIFGEIALKGQDKVESELSGVSNSSKKASMSVKSFLGSIDKTGKSISSFGGNITKYVGGPLTALGGSLVGVVKKTQDLGDQYAKTSKQVGLDAENWQKMTYAMGMNGLTAQDSEKILGRLNQRIGLAEAGKDKYVKALSRLGFSQKEIEGGNLNVANSFERIIKSLKDVESPTQRAEMAMELFGTKVGRRMLPLIESGSESFKALTKEAEENGIISNEAAAQAEILGDAWSRLQIKIEALIVSVGVELMPMFEELIVYIEETAIPSLKKFAEEIKSAHKWFKDLPEPVKEFLKAAALIAVVLGPALVVIGKLMSAFTLLMPLIKVVGVVIGVLTSPIGLVVVALAGLGYAVYEAIKNWDAFKAGFKAIWDFIKTIPGLIYNFAVSIVQSIAVLVEKMLAKNPESRPSASELHQQIKSLYHYGKLPHTDEKETSPTDKKKRINYSHNLNK
ncbi:MAG: phage tail tape measure protein [Halothece sp.]